MSPDPTPWLLRAAFFAAIALAGLGLYLGRGEIAAWRAKIWRPWLTPERDRLRPDVKLGIFGSRWLLQPQWSIDERLNRGLIAILGLLLCFMGLAAFIWTVGEYASAPRFAAEAASSLAEAVTRPSPPGGALEEEITTFLRSRPSLKDRELRAIRFEPVRQEPPCTDTMPVCRPGRPDRPIGRWYGRLSWEHRATSDAQWRIRSCTVEMVLTDSNGWRLEGGRDCA